LRAFWQAHFAQWLAGDLNQREYCEAQGLSLRQFGNWRAEFKYEDTVAERRVLWRRGARVSHATSHAASHMTKPRVRAPVAPMVAATVAAETSFAMHRRTFSRKAKEEIVLETLKPGTTVADVARRYRIAERVLYRWRHDLGVGTPETEPGFASVQIVNNEQPAGTGAQP
jgi:hypothetical protein